MKVVYKYSIGPNMTILRLPIGSQFLSVGVQQNDTAVAWFLCPAETVRTESRLFKVVATGEEFQANGETFLGTFFIDYLVFHLFERR